MKPIKVSFDFDGTLDKNIVQSYAKDLIKNGYSVWIVSSRLNENDLTDANRDWNKDVFNTALNLGIPKENIILTSHSDKWPYIKEQNFIWHLDDDWIELDMINTNTDTVGISVFGHSNWKQKCNKLLNIK